MLRKSAGLKPRLSFTLDQPLLFYRRAFNGDPEDFLRRTFFFDFTAFSGLIRLGAFAAARSG